MEKLRAEDAKLVESCSAVAGLSLGEYCALVFAGALSFEDGLKVWRPHAHSCTAQPPAGKAQQEDSLRPLDASQSKCSVSRPLLV